MGRLSTSLALESRSLSYGSGGRSALVVAQSQRAQSTPERAGHAGSDGARRRKGSKVLATAGNVLILLVTPGNEQERAHIGEFAQAIQEATESRVGVAFVEQGYTEDVSAEGAKEHGMRWEVVKPPEASALTSTVGQAGLVYLDHVFLATGPWL